MPRSVVAVIRLWAAILPCGQREALIHLIQDSQSFLGARNKIAVESWRLTSSSSTNTVRRQLEPFVSSDRQMIENILPYVAPWASSDILYFGENDRPGATSQQTRSALETPSSAPSTSILMKSTQSILRSVNQSSSLTTRTRLRDVQAGTSGFRRLLHPAAHRSTIYRSASASSRQAPTLEEPRSYNDSVTNVGGRLSVLAVKVRSENSAA